VKAIYKAVGNPYMVGAGCEIPVGTPHENLKALCAPVPWK
jgi:uroporphyrinogen-III decarboxylase